MKLYTKRKSGLYGLPDAAETIDAFLIHCATVARASDILRYALQRGRYALQPCGGVCRHGRGLARRSGGAGGHRKSPTALCRRALVFYDRRAQSRITRTGRAKSERSSVTRGAPPSRRPGPRAGPGPGRCLPGILRRKSSQPQGFPSTRC